MLQVADQLFVAQPAHYLLIIELHLVPRDTRKSFLDHTVYPAILYHSYLARKTTKRLKRALRCDQLESNIRKVGLDNIISKKARIIEPIFPRSQDSPCPTLETLTVQISDSHESFRWPERTTVHISVEAD